MTSISKDIRPDEPAGECEGAVPGGNAAENAANAGEMPDWAEWRRRRADWWREHVTARQASGESRTVYCRRHGLNPGGLYHWERKLGSDRPAWGAMRLEREQRTGQPEGGDPVKVTKSGWPDPVAIGGTPAEESRGVRFLPLGLLAAGLGGGLTIWVGAARIEVAAGFDAELLHRVVRALEGR